MCIIYMTLVTMIKLSCQNIMNVINAKVKQYILEKR